MIPASRRARYILFALLLVTAFGGALLPPANALAEVANGSGVHAAVFFALSAALHQLTSRPLWQQLAVLCLFGAVIEFAQGISGYRSASWGDYVADVCGVVAYYLPVALVRWAWASRRAKN